MAPVSHHTTEVRVPCSKAGSECGGTHKVALPFSRAGREQIRTSSIADSRSTTSGVGSGCRSRLQQKPKTMNSSHTGVSAHIHCWELSRVTRPVTSQVVEQGTCPNFSLPALHLKQRDPIALNICIRTVPDTGHAGQNKSRTSQRVVYHPAMRWFPLSQPCS